ncbi:hypothetical protein HRI_002788300 [Hibiscus trionum]|uniref:Non-haem dioxygenase N-terminal domain-containing protein n=1 Tax=Hibiscus trionum TaxID=183268 RepID=A0A9W7MAC4_HIBTR|nr:hypothetical protein HRI_002788300 [Hibiscus trionum]
MEKLVSSWYKNKTLPESYIFPPETRLGNLIVPPCKTIPVIDLSKAEGQNRTHIVQQICKASQEYGFFQFVNHGVPEDLIKETMDLLQEFFELPVEDKALLYSEDPRKKCRLSTSSVNYARENVHHWRDNFIVNKKIDPVLRCFFSAPFTHAKEGKKLICWDYETIGYYCAAFFDVENYSFRIKEDDIKVGVKSTALRFGDSTKEWTTGFNGENGASSSIKHSLDFMELQKRKTKLLSVLENGAKL